MQILENQIKVLNGWRNMDSKIDVKKLRSDLVGPDDKIALEIFEMAKNDSEISDITYYESDRDLYRKKCLIAFIKIMKKYKFNRDTYVNDFQPGFGVMYAMSAIDGSIGVRFGVHTGLYVKTISALGNERHHEFINRALNATDLGCFA